MENVLIVANVPATTEIIVHQLARAHFSLHFATNEPDALQRLKEIGIDLIVTNHRPGDLDAMALVESVRSVSDVPMIVLSDFPSIVDCERAIREGADRFLVLDSDAARLAEVGRTLLTARSPRRGTSRTLTRGQARALAQRELRNRLQRLVIECRGNIAEIARRMDRDRSTVRYHLRRMNMLD